MLQILGKMERALGVKLRGKDMGQPLAAKKKKWHRFVCSLIRLHMPMQSRVIPISSHEHIFLFVWENILRCIGVKRLEADHGHLYISIWNLFKWELIDVFWWLDELKTEEGFKKVVKIMDCGQ